MVKSKLLSRFKRGFTLLEMSVVIITTSILLLGFTAFTIFFSNQYKYETNMMNTSGSATYLKYAIGNNVDRYNYTYETTYDFVTNTENKVNNDKIFTILSLEKNSSGYYTTASIKYFKFVDTSEETGYSYFGYDETIYTLPTNPLEIFNASKYESGENSRNDIMAHLLASSYSTKHTEFIIYQTLSTMRLEVTKIGGDLSTSKRLKYRFTIDFDFEEEVAIKGKQQLVFDKYIYYV